MPRHPASQEAPESVPSLLAHYRSGMMTIRDEVTFLAQCPACGNLAHWLQEREETRVRSTITCSCSATGG